MKVVPQLLYQHPQVKKVMVDGLSCIVHKTIDTIDTNTDHYVAAHVLSVVLKGQLQLESYFEGVRYLASDNQVVFIPKGRYMISDIIPRNGEFEAVFFFFEEDLINDFLRQNSVDSKINDVVNPSLILEYSDRLRFFTEACLQLYLKTNSTNKELTKLKLMELLYLIYNSDQKHQFIKLLSSLENKKKRSIIELMSSNFDKPLSIEDYAFLSGRSTTTFRRDFKRQYRTSPKDWLIQKRMEKAEQLLVAGNLNINQVALETGYDNPSHFIQNFKKRFGTSPKQFLIQNRINEAV